MFNILFSWLSIPRAIGIWIDSIAFSLIDNIYNLIVEFSKLTFFQENTILNVMKSTYVVISIFALFRIALILVNAIISPDKLTDSKNGMGPVLRNLLLMFVLLIFTPTIFNKAYSLQKTIVEGNYVQKIFLQTSAENQNPGKEMKKIVVTALIHPDERIATYNSETKQYDIVDTGCTGNCKDAIDEYNKMLKNNGDSMFTVFTKYIGVTKKIDDETVYVYSYMFIVTLAAGIFITYTLASFGLDIAVRAVELAVLEILSPLFIVTIIEPKSATTGPFHNWLKTVGKTYASLFIKLAILSFMILFISLINKIDTSNIGVMGKVVALLAVLIFAKKAPKWIGDMIGVEGDSAGLGGLGKKIKDGLSVVDNPATRTVAGFAGAAIGNRLANKRRVKALKKEAGLDSRKNRRAKKQELMEKGGKGAYSAYKKDHGLGIGAKNIRNLMGMANAINSGAKGGKNAGNFIGAIKGGIKASGEFAHSKGMNEEGIITKAKDKVTGLGQKMNQIAYGSGTDIYDRNDAADKVKKAKSYLTTEAFDKIDKNPSNGILGMGDLSKLSVKPYDMGEVYALAAAKANGYSYSRDQSGNLVIKDAKDNVQSNDALMSQGRNMYTPEGAANLEKAYNTYQTQAQTDGMANAQYMNQLAQSISAMTESIGKIQIPGINGSYEMPGNKKIELGKETLHNLNEMHDDLNAKKKTIEKTMTESTNQETRQQCIQEMSVIDSQIQAVNTKIAMRSQLENASTELLNRQQQQEDYNRISEGIIKEFKVENGAYILDTEKTNKNVSKTDEEKRAMLASKGEKLQKIVDSFNPTKSDQ